MSEFASELTAADWGDSDIARAKRNGAKDVEGVVASRPLWQCAMPGLSCGT